MYRIFDCELTSQEDLLISGMMRAYHDGADIIALAAVTRIGGFPEDPLSVIVDRIVSKGVFVTVSFSQHDLSSHSLAQTCPPRLFPETMEIKVGNPAYGQ